MDFEDQKPFSFFSRGSIQDWNKKVHGLPLLLAYPRPLATKTIFYYKVWVNAFFRPDRMTHFSSSRFSFCFCTKVTSTKLLDTYSRLFCRVKSNWIKGTTTRTYSRNLNSKISEKILERLYLKHCMSNRKTNEHVQLLNNIQNWVVKNIWLTIRQQFDPFSFEAYFFSIAVHLTYSCVLIR